MSMENKTILICENNGKINEITPSLKEKGYKVIHCSSMDAFIDHFLNNKVDLVLLDIALNNENGINIITYVRTQSTNIPIIVVTSKNNVQTKVMCLDQGADDYLTIPFYPIELMARIRVQFRKYSPEEQKVIVNGELTVDMDAKSVYLQGKELNLTNYQYKIVTMLAKNLNKTVEHDKMISAVWGPYGNDANSLRVFMTGIRKIINKDSKGRKFITTNVGIGYRMMDLND